MQAIRFLHSALAQALPTVHSRRLKTLMCCVSSLLRGRRLTLTGLGRFMSGKAYPKHAIKRVDRLLGNRHLQTERSLFYWVMLRALLGPLKHPLILVDWSPIDAAGEFFLLRAAIPLAGRSFPIYESVYEREGCPNIKRNCCKRWPKCSPKTVCQSLWPMPVFDGLDQGCRGARLVLRGSGAQPRPLPQRLTHLVASEKSLRVGVIFTEVTRPDRDDTKRTAFHSFVLRPAPCQGAKTSARHRLNRQKQTQ